MTRTIRLIAVAAALAVTAVSCTVDPEIDRFESAEGPGFEPDTDPTPTPTATPGTPDPSPTPSPGATPEPTPTGDEPQRPEPGQPATTETLRSLSRFDTDQCSALGLDAALPAPAPTCGWLSVPESWDQAGSMQVEIPVAIFEATGSNLAPPLVYLEGGPGGHALETVAFSYDTLVAPYRDSRDVIVYDQRGAGYSQPSLQCDEVLDLAFDLLDEDLDEDEIRRRQNDAETTCRDRLVDDGVDLTAYHSVASAHDLEALRLALGYGIWDLLGISYGTRLAQTYVRMYGDSVRALVLDSILPVAADPPASFAPNAERAFEALFELCEQSEDCADAHPDLAERYFATVDRLDDDPAVVVATDNLTGTTYTDVVVGGDALLQLTFGALYSPVLYASVPQMVAELERGETELLSRLVSVDVTNVGFLSFGMLLSVSCHEEIAFADPAAVTAALPDHPYYDRFAESANALWYFDTCDLWEAGAAPAEENEPVTSDVPTLLMAGALDPITPPGAIAEVAPGFGRAVSVIFPFGGHAPAAGACGAEVVLAFLTEPTSTPEVDCVGADPPAFVPRPAGPLTLEEVEVSGGGLATLHSLAPVEWEEQGLGVWARSDSLGDPTLLAQFAFGISVDADATFELVVDSFGIGGDPVEQPPLTTTSGTMFRRWRVDDGDAAWDVSIGDDIVIVVAAYADDLDAVLDELADVYESATVTG